MRELLKTIYNGIPLKRPLYITMKKFWKPSYRIYKHLHFKGVITIPVENGGKFKMIHHGYEIENELFWAGIKQGWEKESLKLWIKLCKRSEFIFDVGANTGIYALIAKTMNHKSKVFAFEPVKKIYEKLKSNVELNDFDIICQEKALSNFNGKADIFIPSDTEHVYSVTVNKNLNNSSIKVEKSQIEAITLKSFIEENAVPNIDLIKIDVEMHEPEVLEGFGSYFQKFKPTILIEILTDEVALQIEKIVSGLNYLYFNIDETKGIRQVNKITKSDYYNYLLCDSQTAQYLQLIN